MLVPRSLSSLWRLACWLGLFSLLPSCHQLLHPYPGPPLWRLQAPDQDGETIWLFGTVHRLPYYRLNLPPDLGETASRIRHIPPMPWRTTSVRQALRKADVLFVEMLPLGDRDLLTTLLADQAVADSQEKALPELLGPEQYGELLDSAARRGIRAETLGAADPILAFSLFANTVPEPDGPPERGADFWLMLEAQLQDKPIQGLEVLQDRLLALKLAIARLQGAAQAQVLMQFLSTELDELDIDDPEYQALLNLWLHGDVAMLEQRMQRYAAALPEIYEAFIAARNHYWVERIQQWQGNGKNTFIAVGIGHLVGPDSLLALLEEAGYTLERVQ